MRRNTVAVAALFFTNGAAFASWAPRIPEIADRVDLGLAGLGITLAMVGVGGLIGTQPAGSAVDRFGSRRVSIVGAVVVAAALPVVGFSTTPFVLGIGLFVIGLADVSADLGMNAQAMMLERRGRGFINRFHGLWSIGTVSGGIVGTAAAGAGVSLGVHFSAVGLISAVVAVVARNALSSAAIRPPEAERADRPTTRPLVLLAGLGFLAAFIESPGNEWAATFMDAVFDVSPATAALGFVAFTSGMTLSRMGGDSIAARMGGRRSFFLSLATAGIGWSATVVGGTVPWALFGFAIAGLGTGMLFPQLYAAGGSGKIVSQGRGLSAMSLGARLGFLAATPIIGLWGSASGLDIALGGVVLISIVGAVVLAPPSESISG